MAERFSVRRLPGFATIAMVCFAILYLPIAVLVVYAFNAGESVALWEGVSLRWFRSAWGNRGGARRRPCARSSSPALGRDDRDGGGHPRGARHRPHAAPTGG